MNKKNLYSAIITALFITNVSVIDVDTNVLGNVQNDDVPKNNK